MPTIAAIIPLYNGAAYIEEALQSIFIQDRLADEIIVVDDGSSDSGPDVVKDLIAGHSNLRLLRKANGGQGSARNFGVAHTSCECIAFLDQDDVWYSNHLSVLETTFTVKNHERLGYVYSNPDRLDENGDMLVPRVLRTLPQTKHPKSSLLDCLEQDMHILPGSALIKRAAFVAVGGFDERFRGYEDDDLFVRIFQAGFKTEYLDRPLYGWRDNKSSTSYSLTMRMSRELYFDKLMGGDILTGKNGDLRTVVARRFARLGYTDLKDAIRRHDEAAFALALHQITKFSNDMPYRARTNLRLKTKHKVLRYKMSGLLNGVHGVTPETQPMPLAPN